MKLTADSHGRIQSPELFPPGTSFDTQINPAGHIVLKPLLAEQPKRIEGKLVRRGTRLVMESPSAISGEAIEEAVSSERKSRT